jgi:hypothetical protein
MINLIYIYIQLQNKLKDIIRKIISDINQCEVSNIREEKTNK